MDQSNTQDPNQKKKHDDAPEAAEVIETVESTENHEASSDEMKMDSEDTTMESHAALGSDEKNSEESQSAEWTEEKHKIKIEFPFSDVVRAQAPKAFETVENVATEVTHQWKKDGDFSNLGLPHPLADVVASQALQKAKQLEKKLEEKGVISLAKMGFAVAKSQLENLTKKK